MEQINTAGKTILTTMQTVAYIVAAISGTAQVIQCFAKHDTKQILTIVLYTAIGYLGVFLLPWALDMIRGVFS